MDLKQDIVLFAKNNNIDKIGFCGADPFYNVKNILINREQKGYLSGFEQKDINKQIYPKLTMPNIRSIIVIAENYNKKFEFKLDNKIRGNLSLIAVGEDYHNVIKNKLFKLAEFIKAKLNLEFEYKIFVDTGPLLDREVAKRAGIGWQGKNGSIITKEFGSLVNIGYMLVDFKIQPDNPINLNCGECKRCILACPTKALGESFDFNAKRCISYLTQCKEDIDIELSKKMGFQLYGCDICQKVCPYNKDKPYKSYIYNIDEVKPQIQMILSMSNKEFKNVYGNTAMGWRGKKIIQRNAQIVQANYKYC